MEGDEDVTISALPVHVLTYVFCFLPGPSLSSCASVSTSWKLCSDADLCWKINCAALWKFKASFVPNYSSASNSKLEFTLFHKIRLTRDAAEKLSVNELKTLLRDREVPHVQFLIGKDEFRRRFIATSPPEVEGWSFRHASKWKACYIYSIYDAKRVSITWKELIGFKWTSFHQAEMTVGSFVVVESLFIFNEDGLFEWRGTNPDGSPWIHRNYWHLGRTRSKRGVKSREVVFGTHGIDEINFRVTRLPDWRWELYNASFDWKIVSSLKQGK